MDDTVEEPLWHLTSPVLPPLQRVVQVALRGGGNHRGNQGTDGPRCLKEIKSESKACDTRADSAILRFLEEEMASYTEK